MQYCTYWSTLMLAIQLTASAWCNMANEVYHVNGWKAISSTIDPFIGFQRLQAQTDRWCIGKREESLFYVTDPCTRRNIPGDRHLLRSLNTSRRPWHVANNRMHHTCSFVCDLLLHDSTTVTDIPVLNLTEQTSQLPFSSDAWIFRRYLIPVWSLATEIMTSACLQRIKHSKIA